MWRDKLKAVIFDLDQTLVNTMSVSVFRDRRQWDLVYSNLPTIKLFSGIKEILEYLHNNSIKIAVVTSSPKKYCETVLKTVGVEVNYKVTYWDTQKHKPKPEPFLKALSLLNVKPENCISIGDTITDYQSGERCGVISYIATWGNPLFIDPVIPKDRILRDVPSLMELIERLVKNESSL